MKKIAVFISQDWGKDSAVFSVETTQYLAEREGEGGRKRQTYFNRIIQWIINWFVLD